MNFQSYTVDNIAVLKPAGELRVQYLADYRKVLGDMENKHPGNIAIDLSEISFIDSSGIGLLVNFAKRLKGGRRNLFLVNFSSDIKELLDMANIPEIIPSFPTLDEMKKNGAS
jgi:anti-anti-sigma factor